MNIPHTLIDERSRAMDCLIAEKIRADPPLMARVRAQVEHKLQVHRDSGCRQAALEWKQILDDWPLERVLAFIQEDSERANRLRQSTPFIGILTEQERQEVYHGMTRAQLEHIIPASGEIAAHEIGHLLGVNHPEDFFCIETGEDITTRVMTTSYDHTDPCRLNKCEWDFVNP